MQRWLRHDFQLSYGTRALPNRGSYTVRTCVTTTNYYNVFIRRQNFDIRSNFLSGDPTILLGQKVHRVVNTAQFPTGCIEIAW